MKATEHGLLYSASDLVAFMDCTHRTSLDLRKLRGWSVEPTQPDAAAKLIQDYGRRHEREYLVKLKQRGLDVIEISKQLDIDDQVEATRDAMAAGVSVIYQGALLKPPFIGFPDFLMRVEGASKLGNYHYEVADTKLAKSYRARFMVQLCLYADLLAGEQDRLPDQLWVVLGKLDAREQQERGLAPEEDNTVKLPTRDYIRDVRAARDEFLKFVTENPETKAVPLPACQQCSWQGHCTQEWEASDHMIRVAGIRRTQIAKLEEAGVRTMAALAKFDGDIRGIGAPVLDRLRRQAALQSDPLDEQGQLRIEVLAQTVGDKPKGFDLLPQPDPGDLYFDMEGFPYETGGLEYLFGVGYFEKGDPLGWRFNGFWAHDRDAEKRAFEEFMDFVEIRLAQFPSAHIYHYAPYEKTAINKLSNLHSTRGALRDRLLREERLVDLYRVVTGAVLLALPSYSIKKVESYYRAKRDTDVANAGESIVQYEAYRAADNQAGKVGLLQSIEQYNQDDVESTRQLHVWLESLRTDSSRRIDSRDRR
jgi:predicted RecB family nuclease